MTAAVVLFTRDLRVHDHAAFRDRRHRAGRRAVIRFRRRRCDAELCLWTKPTT